ncbi:MAG: PAS domain S-box protein [Opitutus sp.]
MPPLSSELPARLPRQFTHGLGDRFLSVPWKQYAATVAIVAVGAALQWLLTPVLGDPVSYLTLYPAVAIAAFVGGFGPGMMAAVLAVLAVAIGPGNPGFWPTAAERISGFVFLASCAIISAVAEVAGRSRSRLQEKTRDLVETNAKLQTEVTRRENAETRLRESEERFRIATASDGITLFEQDRELRYTWLHPEHGNSLGKTDADLLPGGESNVLAASKRQVLASGIELRTEVRAALAGGTRYYDTFISARRGRDGSIVGITGAALDVTDRKRAEENRQRLAAAVEFSDDAIIGNDLEGLITSWNEGAAKTFGFAANEVIGKSITLLVPPERRDEEPRLLVRVLGGERIEHFETRRQRKDGTTIDVSLTISPIRNDEGEIIGAAKIAREITHRVRREQTARLLTMLNSRIVTLEDPDEIIRVASEITGRHLGADRCYFAEWDETSGQLTIAGDWATDTRERFEGRYDLSEFGSPDWRQRVAAGMSVADVEHDSTFTAYREKLRALNVRSYVASGFMRKEPWVVSLVATASEPREWSDHELQLVKAVAQRVWPLVERARSDEALRRSEQQLRLVTDSAPVFLAHLDPERRFKFVNEPFARRYGRPVLDIIGEHVADVVGPASYALFREHLDAAFEGYRREFELEEAPEGAAETWVHVVYTPEVGPDGVVGVLALITDITARKEAEREVERARDQAVAASRAKDDFLAALSHELRTPLNPVLLIASEAAENPLLAPEVRRDFATIRKSVELEARLIDDLLDLTRITNGKLPLDRHPVEVDTVLLDALSVIRPDASDKRIGLILDLRTPEVVVNADTVRLQQVFWNVLKNAVKFTPPGGRITIQTTEAGDDLKWRVSFTDTGIGMTEAEMRRVFDAFTQGEHAVGGSSHRFGGVGLGLTISRMLVELHGGTIHAASEGPGRGSTFLIELPTGRRASVNRHFVATQREVNRVQVETTVGPASRRVLVVEDHGPTREALAGLLRRRNLEVVTAGSVEEARERADAGNISLVVSDIGLPDGDGCDLMTELRQHYGLKGIALTGYGREADVARSARAGFIAHLTKPVRVQALDAALAAAWTSEAAEPAK